jgi:hypothetical protein
VCVGSVLTALDSGIEYLATLSTGKDLALDLAENLFTVDMVHLYVQGPTLSCKHLVAAFMGTSVVIL